MMQELYQKRKALQRQKMLRYFKYIFNDHFILVCFVLFGGLTYYYADLVKQLTPQNWWAKIFLVFFFFLLLSFGKLATFIDPADEVFLLPKERALPEYLQKAIRYSFLLPLLVGILLIGWLMPLIAVLKQEAFFYYPVYLVLFACLKYADLQLQMLQLYQNDKRQNWSQRLIFSGISLISIVLSIFSWSWLGLISAFFLIIWYTQNSKKILGSISFNWEFAIEKEQIRLKKIRQFIQLFTDVPGMSGGIKRRKWADPLLKIVPKKYKHTYDYLYLRSFIRGTEFSGLFFRLVLIAGLILCFLHEFWFALGFALLFLYLIGFQLLPIYSQFDYMVLTQLYPIPVKVKLRAVEKLIGNLLIFAGVIFLVISSFVLRDITAILWLLLGIAIVVGLFTKIYAPYRLRKMENNF